MDAKAVQAAAPGNYRMLEQIRKSLLSTGVPISKLGLFGSSVFNDAEKDIDILLTVIGEAPEDSQIYRELVEIVDRRMRGDYSLDAPLDPQVCNLTEECAAIIASVTGLPVIQGLGGANPHSHEGRWVHLNGPFTDSLWETFTARFPILAWGLRNNYVPFHGEEFRAPSFSGHDLLAYCSDMAERASVMPSLRYVRKFVKVIAMLSGEKSARLSSDLEACFGRGTGLFRALSGALDGATCDEGELSLCLVEMIRQRAKLMVAFNLWYPEDWSVR